MKSFTQPNDNKVNHPSIPKGRRSSLPRHRWQIVFLMILTTLFLSACQAGQAPPQEICDLFEDSIFTVRLFGTAALLLSMAILGFKKQLSNIFPSQGAQTGTVASAAILGLALLAFSTGVGSDILATFGLDTVNMFTLCGL